MNDQQFTSEEEYMDWMEAKREEEYLKWLAESEIVDNDDDWETTPVTSPACESIGYAPCEWRNV